MSPDEKRLHALFEEAVRLHAAGSLDEAASHYEQLLQLQPDLADAHCNLGTVLATQGKMEEALARFRLALVFKPDYVPAHFNLGVVLGARGNTPESIDHLEKALAADPSHQAARNLLADAYNDLGNALYAQGNVDEAADRYSRAVAVRPDLAIALSNLALAMHDRGRIVEAIELCRRALQIDPHLDHAHNNLGLALMADGKNDEAVEHFEQALAANPNHADAHANLAIVLTYRARFEEARSHYAQAIAIRPNFITAHYNRIDLKTYHRGDPDLAALEALAGTDGLPAKHMIFLHFALAKALEDSGEYARAWEHMHKGNALKRRQIEYDEAAMNALFERIAAVFDRSLFQRFEGQGDPSPAPIFVVGMPRSGSTLVEQILASHPQVHGAGELPDLALALEGLHFPESISTMDGRRLRQIGRAYLERLPLPGAGQTRIVDKMPDNFLRIGLIRLILPNAKIVHTIRDPIDTCLSCYSKLFTWGVEYSYDLGELGRYYQRYRSLMDHWRSVLLPGDLLEVSYEETVSDLEAQARRLIAYCGLPWNDRCLQFHANPRAVRTASAVQVRKPVYRSSLERWRRYESGLQPLIEALLV